MDGTTSYKQGYGGRPIWQWVVLYLAIAIVLYGAVYFFLIRGSNNYNYNGYSGSNMNSASNSTVTSVPSPSQASTMSGVSGSAKQKFIDLPNYKYAYKIFPGPISEQSKTAMSGFVMEIKNLSGGSTQINLVAQKIGYTSQTYTVKKGDSLYFIEKFSGDDNPTADTDATPGDDTAVIVDPQGYIVQ